MLIGHTILMSALLWGHLMSPKLIHFEAYFSCIFESLRSNSMMNYGIFTKVYVLMAFNAKEAKRVEKATKIAKTGKWKILQHNFTMS